jgi:hypothetical protein
VPCGRRDPHALSGTSSTSRERIATARSRSDGPRRHPRPRDPTCSGRRHRPRPVPRRPSSLSKNPAVRGLVSPSPLLRHPPLSSLFPPCRLGLHAVVSGCCGEASAPPPVADRRRPGKPRAPATYPPLPSRRRIVAGQFCMLNCRSTSVCC